MTFSFVNIVGSSWTSWLACVQVDVLEEGEWLERPEFSYCDVAYECQQVQAEFSELADEEIAWLQSGVRKEGDLAAFGSRRKTGRRVRASWSMRSG